MFVLDVSGIGCGGCASKITKTIQSLNNETTVSVDCAAGKVDVESNESPERVCTTVEASGSPSKVSV